MATHPHPLDAPADPRFRDLHELRVRRWCWMALAAAVLAALYMGALAWATQEIGAGVARSIQPLPAVMRDNPATD